MKNIGTKIEVLEEYFEELVKTGVVIDRFRIDEYQFIVGMDSCEICCSTRAILSNDQGTRFEFYANKEKRDIESYGICSIVGDSVARIEITEEALVVYFQESSRLEFCGDFEFENFDIQCSDIGIFTF